MFDHIIKWLLICLLVFTPIALGSVEIWAFSLMELGILLLIALYIIQNLLTHRRSSGLAHPRVKSLVPHPSPPPNDPVTQLPIDPLLPLVPRPSLSVPVFILSLFLALVLLQMIPLPSAVLKVLSPKAYELRTYLMTNDSMTKSPSPLVSGLTPYALRLAPSFFGLWPLSLSPFATKVEFSKWITLTGFFIILLRWKGLGGKFPGTNHLLVAILLVGVAESLYGMLEFFSGHRHILYLEGAGLMSSVTGTFINRNYLAGYLLMVIPLSIGYLLARGADQAIGWRGWRNRLSSLDGKSLLIGFGIIVIILGLLFTASRMGILSLLLSFTLISILFRDPRMGKKVSGTSVLIFSLAFLWAAWIGLDAVISRFFTTSEDFKTRWMIWINTFQIIKDFPLLGSGLGTFAQIFPMYRSFPILGLVTHAENDFLQLASETGLVGIGILFILFIFLLMKAIVGIRSLSSGEPRRYIAIGAMVGILGLMLHSLVERNIQVPANAFLYTFLWATVLQITHRL